MLVLTSCAAPQQTSTAITTPTVVLPDIPLPPPAPREFRAAWVSTVANIDWPSKAGLPVSQQQAEIRAILDAAVALKLNAVLLQVRPSADALYASTIEPWSEYLTGEQGRAPEPFYDPLQMWISEAHARGLELHAWFNPYRARHSAAKSPAATNHISRTQPGVVKAYGDFLWLDPAEPAAMQRTIDVVSDVVKRYDIDGVHIDDYFYPYPVNGSDGNELAFPDNPSWQRYLAGGGKLARDDWRRDNVNQLVQRLYTAIHAEKNWVKFGISPFGLGKPDRRAAGIVGFSQYDKLYADAERWLSEGWLDYLAPQLYWQIDPPAQAFATLLAGWTQENTKQRHIWPGLFTSNLIRASKPWPVSEITRQIDISRSTAGVSGHIHFSMVALMPDKADINHTLQTVSYSSDALVPGSPWLDQRLPAPPQLTLHCVDGIAESVSIEATTGKAVNRYAIWLLDDKGWHFSVQASTDNRFKLPTQSVAQASKVIAASSLDRVSNESLHSQLVLKCQSANQGN